MGSSLSLPIAYADRADSEMDRREDVPPTDESSDSKSLSSSSTSDSDSFSSDLSAKVKEASDSKSKEPSGKHQSWWDWLTTHDPSSDIPNPGGYDDLNQEAMIVLRPNLIDGLSFNFNAPLSEVFALGSALDMGGKDTGSVFAINANYFTNKVAMISRTTPSNGRVLGRLLVNHSPALTTKVVADVGPEPDSSRVTCDFDYRAMRSSSQIKVASGRIFAFNHLHSVSKSLALGGEALVQARSGFAAVTLGAKYSNASQTASLSVATFGPVIASYVRKVNPKVSFATELFVDGRTKDSLVTMGYRFDLSTSTVIGHIDSTGKVAATLEERINPALSLILSAQLDHPKEAYSFGFGVNIGGG